MSDEIKSYYFSELYTWTIYKTCAVDSHNPILNEWIESSILQQVSFHQDQEKYKEWLGKNNIYIKVCTKSFLDVCVCVCVLCPEHSPISSNNKQTNKLNKQEIASSNPAQAIAFEVLCFQFKVTLHSLPL